MTKKKRMSQNRMSRLFKIPDQSLNNEWGSYKKITLLFSRVIAFCKSLYKDFHLSLAELFIILN